MMTRREFLGTAAATAAGALLPAWARGAAAPRAQPRIPRWRGFNLTEMSGFAPAGPFAESDFEWMEAWGFDFARLPMSYRLWSSPQDWMKIDPAPLKFVDQGIELGRRYGVHICLCFGRIPGYAVNSSGSEPDKLFGDTADTRRRALDAACRHWRYFAERYRDVPASRLSFDLFNEPPFMTDQSRYVEIARALIATIRSVSPDRLIIVDGADIGQTPVLGLADEGVVQSSHDYQPKMVSHYGANWVPAAEYESFARPTWPMVDRRGVLWDKEKLRREEILKWRPLTERGVPVHVGEFGCYNQTPHEVALAWMRDSLSLWKGAGWGWALWNLRGSFGLVDSERTDVAYEDFQGHKLDRKMLELLRES